MKTTWKWIKRIAAWWGIIFIVSVMWIGIQEDKRQRAIEKEDKAIEEKAKAASGYIGEIGYHETLYIPPNGQPYLTYWDTEEYWIDGKCIIKRFDKTYPIVSNVPGYLPGGTKAISYLSENIYDHVTIIGYCNFRKEFSVIIRYADGKYALHFYSVMDLRKN